MTTQGEREVDYRRIHELSEEFTRLWNKLHGFYLDASAGFTLIRQRVETEQERMREIVRGSECDSQEFQDSLIFSYSSFFSNAFVASPIHQATQGEVRLRNRADGSNFTTLGQLCIVSFYDFWEEYLRKEYAIAKGYLRRDEKDPKVIDECLRTHVAHDLWGDIGIIRQCIVHNLGVATSKVERCKIIKWYNRGDPISVTPEQMRALFLAFLNYRNELSAEQFPPHTIQIPVS